MANTTLPYTYTDGAVLVAASHNSNIFDTDGVDSILGNSNGGIETTELAAGWSVRSHHIQPGEHVWMDSNDADYRVDYMDDLVATEVEDFWVPVENAICRTDLPWDATLVIWQVSFFMHPFLAEIVATSGDPVPSRVEHAAQLQLYLNGSAVEHSLRPVPRTVMIEETASPVYTIDGVYENRACLWFNLIAVERNATAGPREIELRLNIDNAGTSKAINGSVAAQTYASTGTKIHTRVSFGVRNPDVIALL